MKKPNTQIIEHIKTALLVVLFFTTVLLLYFFWENASADPFKLATLLHTQEVAEEVPKVEDTVIPTGITVSFGGGIYTVISDGEEKLWKRALDELRKFSQGQGTGSLVKEIPKETYVDAVNNPSIQFQFHYDIPFQEFCTYYELKKNQGYEIIEGVSTVAYSALSKESILIYQQKNDKYYAIIADKDYTNFSTMLSEIERAGYPSYYPAGTFFGASVQNRTLLPLSLQSELLEIGYKKESANTIEIKVQDLAESFFGKSFDFTRRTKDIKGNWTYMYGYGQKIFNIYTDGSFEYKEIPLEGQNTPTLFFESLDIALNFVATHGTWNSLDGTETSAYLQKVVPIGEEKKKGYRFLFGMKLGTQNVYYENGAPIMVDVIGSQVVGYRRNMIDFEQDALKEYLSGEPRDTFDPVNTVTTNYEYIYNTLKTAGAELQPITAPETLEDIVNLITSMEIGYVRQNMEEGESEGILLPCYRITFGKKVTFYFDLFNDAVPIGLTTETAPQLLVPQEGGK